MEPTAALCRAQEAFHQDRATNAPLENVRNIAAKAAVAWGLEAVLAERREARQARTRTIAAMMTTQKQRANDDDDEHLFSENPDRGLAER